MAHQAAGIVLREFGDVKASVRELRRALHCARQACSAEREVDVLASLGVALVYAGRTADGLATFELAVERSSGVLTARVLHRRGLALWAIGRYPAALEDLRHAVSVLGRAGDPVWAARALTARGLVYESVGLPERADADFVAAGRLFAETSQELESIYTVQNRALVAFGSGNLPAALSLLDEAAARFRPLGVPLPTLGTDRCAVLLAAGLADDALAEADAAVRDFEQVGGRVPKRAELLLIGQPTARWPPHGLSWPLTGRRQPTGCSGPSKAPGGQRGRRWWWPWARHAGGVVSVAMLHEANRAVARLETLGASEVVQAHLLAGRVALELGRAR